MVESCAPTAPPAPQYCQADRTDATAIVSTRKLLRKSSFNELRAAMLEEASRAATEGSLTPPQSPGNREELPRGGLTSASGGSSFKDSSIASDHDAEHNSVHLNTVNSAWLGRQFSSHHRKHVASASASRGGPPSLKLQRDCQRGVELLKRLQLPIDSRTNVSSEPALPKTALRFSKGLAFMWQRKAGLLASYTWGSGFVVARLAPKIWSAPCFLKDRFISLGATAGFRTLDTLYAIPTDDGIRPFDTDYAKMAVDLALTLEFDPWQLDAPVAIREAGRQLPASNIDPSEQPKAYTVSDGAIWDVSVRFGVHMVDSKQNEQVYGVGVTASQILEGEIEVPEEFLPLYDTISELALSATLVRSRPSLFELEKSKLRSKSSFKRQIQREKFSGSINRSISLGVQPFEGISNVSIGGLSRSSIETSVSAISSGSNPRDLQEEIKSPESSFQLFPGIEIDLDVYPLTAVEEEELSTNDL